MTIDTSREAVERLLDGVTPGPWKADGPNWNQIIWSSDGNRVCFMAHSNGIDVARDIATANFIAASRELVPALLAERDAALAEVARLSTPPDDAEVLELYRMQRDRDLCWQNSDRTADALTRLSQTLAAETAKRVAMEEERTDIIAKLATETQRCCDAEDDRDEERKLADDLAEAVSDAKCGIPYESAWHCMADTALARHAARRK